MFKSVSINFHTKDSLKDWIHALPCVVDGRVSIDVRGPYMIAIVGLRTRVITCKDDMIFFVIEVIK